MEKMALAQSHGRRCPFGCCGTLPRQRWLGKRKSETKDRIKRALRHRDRQQAKKFLTAD